MAHSGGAETGPRSNRPGSHASASGPWRAPSRCERRLLHRAIANWDTRTRWLRTNPRSLHRSRPRSLPLHAPSAVRPRFAVDRRPSRSENLLLALLDQRGFAVSSASPARPAIPGMALHPIPCPLSVLLRELAYKIIGGQQRVDHAARAVPIECAVAVASGHEACTRIEHFVLRVPRAEFGADGVPSQLQEFDLFARGHFRRALRRLNDFGELGVGEVPNRRRQHDQRAAGEFAQRVDDARVHILRQHLRRIHIMPVWYVPFTTHRALGFHAREHRTNGARVRCKEAELLANR